MRPDLRLRDPSWVWRRDSSKERNLICSSKRIFFSSITCTSSAVLMRCTIRWTEPTAQSLSCRKGWENYGHSIPKRIYMFKLKDKLKNLITWHVSEKFKGSNRRLTMNTHLNPSRSYHKIITVLTISLQTIPLMIQPRCLCENTTMGLGLLNSMRSLKDQAISQLI